MNWTITVLFLIGISLAWATPARFDDHQMYTVSIATEGHLSTLQSIYKNSSLIFVDPPLRIGQTLSLIVAPSQLALFHDIRQRASLPAQLRVSNVQTLMDREQVKSRTEGYNLEEYHSVDEMYEWLNSLAVTYPDIVHRMKGGDTYEGRSIEGVKLMKNLDRPGIFIEANIHGNEWITSAGANWIINELLTSTDPEIQALLDNYTWYFMPMLNPDGYEYSRSTNRMWRKTRARHGLICFGTDPNRNWDWLWEAEGVGASSDICDQHYAGSAPNSEIEVRTLTANLLRHKGEIKAYFAFHSAIRMLLTSWGHTPEVPEDHDIQMQILTRANERLFATHGSVYTIGPVYDTICKLGHIL